MSRRSGLGRGLAALIPPSPPPAPGTDAADEDDEPRGDEVHPPAPEDPEDTVDADASGADAAADGHLGAPTRTDGDTDTDTEGRGTTGSATDADPQRDVAPDDPDTTHEAEVSARGERSAPPAPPSGVIAPSAATLAEIDPAMIVPNPRQPREVFDPEEIEGLAISLSDIGVLQPLVVRPAADGRFELIAGERRLRAAKLAGLARVPAVVRHTDDTEMLKEALVENIHRVQLNPLEEAAAYQQLLEEFGVTQDELAASLGRSRPAISNAIRLLQLPTDVQRRVAAGVLSAGHAKVLLALEDPTTQARLADRIVAEGLSVRATEELIRLRLLDDDDRERGGSKRRRATTAPGLIELQEDLSDALEARVRISMGARKGKLAIEFASVDDLERIVGVIANGLGGNAGATSGLLEPSGVEDAPQGADGTPEPPDGRGG